MCHLKKLFLVLALLMSFNGIAQEKKPETKKVKKVKKVKKNRLIKVAPYINYDRKFGGMFGAVPIAMYKLNKKDTISPSSITGIGGIYTTNKSYGYSVFGAWYFNEDHWRVKFSFGGGTINSQVYIGSIIDTFIDYGASIKYLFFEINGKIISSIYGGASYINTRFDNTFQAFNFPIQTNIALNGLGVNLTWDDRDNKYYSRKGFYGDVRYTFYPEYLDNKENTRILRLKLDSYFPVRHKKDVLATRLFIGFGFGDVPFNKEQIIGGLDLRGYTQGEYRGKQKVALQGEYRYNFESKLGMVGFLGIGSVFNSFNKDFNGQVLPSYGAGIRYSLFEENHLNFGLDIAGGKKDWGIYFRIGESF